MSHKGCKFRCGLWCPVPVRPEDQPKLTFPDWTTEELRQKVEAALNSPEYKKRLAPFSPRRKDRI